MTTVMEEWMDGEGEGRSEGGKKRILARKKKHLTTEQVTERKAEFTDEMDDC